MSDMQQLEAMGYRFRLEGEAVRYSVLGEPPPGAEALLRRLDRAQVRDVLRDRQRGYPVVKPREVVVPWAERYPYLYAVKAALDAGEVLDVQVTYIRRTRTCVYHLTPPEADLTPWLEHAREEDERRALLCRTDGLHPDVPSEGSGQDASMA